MQCHFINLEAARARREAFERNFSRIARPSDRLLRFEAVTAEVAASLPGAISAAEKACFCSHREVVTSLPEREVALVMEDDVRLSSRALATIETLAAGGAEWDLLFTDVGLFDRNAMIGLVGARRDFSGEVRLLNLAETAFAGATSYAVHPRARERLSEALHAADALDQPYDLFLRKLVYSGQLKAVCAFPFLSSFSDEASSSQIQGDAKTLRDLPSFLFRMLMYVDRDLEACRALARQIDTELCDEDARLAGAVFAGMASAAYAAAKRR